ncbi:hypothetical protein L7F22_003724 [Adiantum nelumboides]|nr:hypothetical protein [Adiantum nelumboides]
MPAKGYYASSKAVISAHKGVRKAHLLGERVRAWENVWLPAASVSFHTIRWECGFYEFSTEQAARDPMAYFNLRMLTCPATVLADGSRILYFEQGFGRTPERPYRQRFYEVKPCPNEMKCDVEVGSYAVRDVEEYRNFCDRSKNQRPQPEEVVGDMAEHLMSVYLTRCKRGERCLYEGSTPPNGFPNAWNGATYCTSKLSILRNGEVHAWDQGYDDEGNQVWGVKEGPYEFKPSTLATFGAYQNSELLNYNGKRLEETPN